MSGAVGVPFALWLIPSDVLLGRLRGAVADLANRFSTPLFGPHATLCSGEWASGLQALRHAMDVLCQGLRPVCLSVRGLGQTDDYFTFFYIELTDDDPQQVFRRAASAISGARSPAIGPHVSLMYGDRVSDIDRGKLARELGPTLPRRITFESVQLVMPATGTWRDVAGWQVGHSARLALEPGAPPNPARM